MKQEYAMAYAAGAGLWLVMMVQQPSPEESLHAGKLTWHWNMDPLYKDAFTIEIRNIPVSYVSFPEGKSCSHLSHFWMFQDVDPARKPLRVAWAAALTFDLVAAGADLATGTRGGGHTMAEKNTRDKMA